jgi:AAA domain
MLFKAQPKTYADVEQLANRVLASGVGSPIVRQTLASCCHRDPERRPPSAQMLYASIVKEGEKFLTSGGIQKSIAFRISQNFALKTMADDDSLRDAAAVGKMIEEDLGDNPFLERIPSNLAGESPKIGLLGRRNFYLSDPDKESGAYLFIFAIKMRNMAANVYEEIRANAFNPKVALKYKIHVPQNEKTQRAKEVLSVLNALDEFEKNRSDLRRREEKKRLLHNWQRMLEAQFALVDGPIGFERTNDGEQGDLNLRIVPTGNERAAARGLSESIIGQIRSVRPTPDNAFVQVEILSFDGDEMTCAISAGSSEDIPSKGILMSDNIAQEAALTRQRKALDRIRSGSSVRSDLADMLADPRIAMRPHDLEVLEYSSDELDEDKKECVRKAIVARDFLVVQGPPGTGKTTFIRELVHQVLKKDPQARILLSAQTNVALDHALDGIAKIPIVRIQSKFRQGKEGRASGIRSLDETVIAWKQKTSEASRRNISILLTGSGIAQEDAEKIILIRTSMGEAFLALEREKQAALVAGKVKLLMPEWSDEIPISQFKDHAAFEDASEDYTEHRNLLREAKDIRRAAFERARSTGINGARDVAELIHLLELQMKAYLSKSSRQEHLVQMLDLWDQWSARLQRSDEFSKEVLGQAAVVAATCVGLLGVSDILELAFDTVIIDEASKANPTEALIPMAFGRKWILVGDDRQLPPYVGDLKENHDILEDYGLKKEDLEATLFGHLSNGLHESCRVSLSTQHRMIEPIGKLISDCFYDGMLRSQRSWDKSSWSYPEGFMPVTWIDTGHLKDNGEVRADGSSLHNPCEAKTIVEALRRINEVNKVNGKKIKVLLLSGYKDQVQRLASMIESLQVSLASLLIEVNTIDSAQGRESDVCIFSCVRSNEHLRYGFLRETRRINVALSRARDLLIIVGNSEFHYRTDAQNPLRNVLQHIEDNGHGCKIIHF